MMQSGFLKLYKMASNAGRIFQTVKPHIRMINFPKRTRRAKDPGSASSDFGAATISPEMLKLARHQTISVPLSAKQTPQTTAMSSAISANDLSADISFKTLPERFRRQPITLEEMEYIERGGPD